MTGASKTIGRKSSWSRTGPTARMLIGVMVICLVGYLGQTPKTLLGVQLVWPHAALWAAVGWASVGLSIRPMLILCALGVAQDVSFDGPIAVFWMVNLVTYGCAAMLSQSFDVEDDPLMALMVAAVSISAGFFLLWLLASSTADHAVRVWPLLQEGVITLLFFLPVAGLFRLGGLPGQRAGAA